MNTIADVWDAVRGPLWDVGLVVLGALIAGVIAGRHLRTELRAAREAETRAAGAARETEARHRAAQLEAEGRAHRARLEAEDRAAAAQLEARTRAEAISAGAALIGRAVAADTLCGMVSNLSVASRKILGGLVVRPPTLVTLAVGLADALAGVVEHAERLRHLGVPELAGAALDLRDTAGALAEAAWAEGPDVELVERFRAAIVGLREVVTDLSGADRSRT